MAGNNWYRVFGSLYKRLLNWADPGDPAGMPTPVVSEHVGATLVDSDGAEIAALPTAPVLPGTQYHGEKTVTAAGTAEALAATATVLVAGVVQVKALDTNTDTVYVGGATVDAANGWPLAAGEEFTFLIGDLADVYVDAAVNGEGVRYHAS